MNSQSDQELLREYVTSRSEPAFAELVRRHTDLVYSAAVRMVCDGHLAKDVAQGVFVALAQNASHLTDRAVLSGWLHRTAQNLASKTVRSDVRRRAREQEAVTMNELLSAEPNALWEQIAPQLDAALGELSEQDRDALMLRYFERKSARDMAQTLGVSDDAAQKRVSRAVERVREVLAKRGVAVGASGLVAALAANSVQAAPAGLAASFVAAGLAGTAVAGAATAATAAAAGTASLTTMTTLKVGLIGAVAAAAALTAPVVLQHQSRARLQAENDSLRQQIAQEARPAAQAAPADPAAGAGSGALSEDQFRELLRLRAEVTQLRQEARESAWAGAGTNDAMASEVNSWLVRVKELKSKLDERPDLKIPELVFLTPKDWLSVALDARLDSDAGTRRAFHRLRSAAKQAFAPMLRQALNSYVAASGGQLPSDVSQLKPYFSAPVDDALLERYQIVRSGDATAEPTQDPVIAEQKQVDPDFDSLLSVGLNGASMKGEGVGGGFAFSSRFSGAGGFGGGTNAFGTGGGGFGGGAGTRASTTNLFFDNRSGMTNATTAPQ